MSALGRRIRELRKELNLSQEGLAALADVTPKYISQVETARANPSILVLRSISENGLKMPLAALLNFDLSRSTSGAVAREVTGLLRGVDREKRDKALAILRAFLAE